MRGNADPPATLSAVRTSLNGRPEHLFVTVENGITGSGEISTEEGEDFDRSVQVSTEGRCYLQKNGNISRSAKISAENQKYQQKNGNITRKETASIKEQNNHDSKTNKRTESHGRNSVRPPIIMLFDHTGLHQTDQLIRYPDDCL